MRESFVITLKGSFGKSMSIKQQIEISPHGFFIKFELMEIANHERDFYGQNYY